MPAGHEDAPRAEWIEVGTYATGLDADIARNALELAGIPVLVRSNAAGIFGLAFQGVIAGGIALQVPSPELDHARDVLREYTARHLALVEDEPKADHNRAAGVQADDRPLDA